MGVSFLAGYGAGTTIQGSLPQVPEDIKMLAGLLIMLCFAGLGLLNTVKRFMPKHAHTPPAGGGTASIDALIETVAGQADWRANVVGALTAIAQTDRATFDRLEQLMAKVQENVDHTRHVLANTIGGVAGHVELTGKSVDNIESAVKDIGYKVGIIHDRTPARGSVQ